MGVRYGPTHDAPWARAPVQRHAAGPAACLARSRSLRRAEEATGFKKGLLDAARHVATQVNQLKLAGREPQLPLLVQYELARKVVLSKLKFAIGLSNARICVSGAAPIGQEVLEFFASLDIIVYEVHGQSEGSGPTSKVHGAAAPVHDRRRRANADAQDQAQKRQRDLGARNRCDVRR